LPRLGLDKLDHRNSKLDHRNSKLDHRNRRKGVTA